MAEPEWMKLAKQHPGTELDFQVRVHIIEARDLQPRDKNGMSDPVCVVRVFDQKKNTKVFQKTTSCTWDTLMFFELKMTPEEFFHGKINITVMDANTVLRDVEIGSYEFDVAYVHSEKGHELFRKWVALAYKSDNEKIRGRTNGIQGYLKLSLCVLGPQDQAPAHDESEDYDEEGSETDLQSMVLLPPSISAQDYALECYTYRAEGLPKMDTFGKCDGYVRIKFGGTKEQDTTIIKENFNPQWLEKLTVPVQLPTMADLIKIQVMDYDRGSKDEIVATTYLRLNELMKVEEWKQPRWVNLYGVPEGVNPPRPSKQADLFDKINEGNVEGSSFRGRLLLSFRCIEALQPKASKVKVNSPADPITSQYVFRFDVLEVSQLPKDSDISVEVTLGLFKQETGKFKVENGNSVVYESLPEQIMALPQDIQQVPDVFINVYRHLPLLGKKRIGYVRINPADLNDEFAIKSNTITPDPFADFDKSQALGFISYNLNLGVSGKSIPRTTLSKPKYKKYQLRAHIYQGRDLPSADKEGTSDPYCVINLGKSSGKTKTLKETIFPIWYESVTFNVELPEGYNPEIHVSVWDWDRFDPDDFLGRFSVPTNSVNEKLPEEPTWFPIYSKDPNTPEGAILASFQLIPEERASQVAVANIVPKSRACTLQCNVIGIRELIPYDLLPINKPFITIDAGLDTKVNTKGSSHPNANNPNFLESLNLQISVPENPLFAPPINIKVFDDRLIHKPLIAARSISTAPYIPWTATKIEVQDESALPTVDVIPGAPKEEVEDLAKALQQLTKSQQQQVNPNVSLEEDTINSVQLEIYEQKEDQSLNLITTTNEDIMTIHSDLMNCISTSETTSTQEIVIKGDDETPEERETVKSELEKTFTKKAFDVYKMYRAKKKHGKRYRVEVGDYKGQFSLVEGNKPPPSKIAELYKQTPYVVRVYVLEGYQLVPKDTDGNNPYLKIQLGKTKIKDMDTAKQVTSRPQFYKCYEIPCIFPDETMLHLEVWDYDKFSSDDLIGSTSIDLEQRINSEDWKNLKKKPIEYRTLWNPVSSNPQGQLRLWVDILTPEEAAKNPPEPITPPAPHDYEIRVIVWDTRNVILKDNDGKRSDILVVGIMEGQQPQSTDTHWNSKDGTGMFNWRMKFSTKVPGPNSRLKLQVWDRNVLTPNGAICEANLNLRNFFMKAYKNKLPRLELEQQWVTMTHPAATGPQGEISVTVEILTIEEAQKRPAGFGREAPNDNPPLAEPNRPADSLAPWRLDKKMALGLKNWWGGNKWKIYGCLICVVVVIIVAIAIYLSIIF